MTHRAVTRRVWLSFFWAMALALTCHAVGRQPAVSAGSAKATQAVNMRVIRMPVSDGGGIVGELPELAQADEAVGVGRQIRAPAAAQWVRIDNGDPQPTWGTAFTGSAFDRTRRRMYIMLENSGIMARFDPTTGVWERFSPLLDRRHNCSLAHDPLNDRVWLSACAPQGQEGSFYLDLAKNEWVRASAGNPPVSTDPALLYDPVRRQLIGFGGWNMAGNVRTLAMPLVPVGPWQDRTATGPALATDYGKETNARSGWDHNRGVAWVLDDHGVVWRYDPGANTWAKLLTTGAGPPHYAACGLHEGADTLVCWVGHNGWAGSDPSRRETHLLDLAGSAWRMGPSASGADTVPPAGVYSSLTFQYDPVGRQLILRTGIGATGDNQTWALRFAGGAPAEVPMRPPPAGPSATGRMPLRTFVPVPLPAAATTDDTTPWPTGGETKHVRFAYDSRRKLTVTGFGDHGPSRDGGHNSQNMAYAFDAATGTWTRWQAGCRPAGQIMPASPDEVPWAYDPGRHGFWLLGGVLQAAAGTVCNSAVPGAPTGATLLSQGLFFYDLATDRWQQVSTQVGTDALFGHFDPARNELVYIETGGGGSQITQLNVVTLQKRWTSFNVSPVPYPGNGRGNFVLHPDGRLHHWAWDAAGRTGYIVTVHKRYRNHVEAGVGIHFHSWHADRRQVTRLPDPPNTQPGRWVDPDTQDVLWDSVNGVVLYPYTPTHAGVIEGMYVYNPRTALWETCPVALSAPVPGGRVRGNGTFFDPDQNMMVLGGSYASGDWGYPGLPRQTHFFLWRYGP